MIVKDNGRHIAECLSSVMSHVSELVVVDTGSTDDTKNVIKNAYSKAKLLDFTPATHPRGFLLDSPSSWKEAVPGPFTNKPMLVDFGAARQIGWVEASSDFIMWLDSDDLVSRSENLPTLLERMEREKLATAMLNYDYEDDGNGHVTCRLWRERIMRRLHGSRWVQPVHEILMPPGPLAYFEEVNIVHRRRHLGPPEVANRNLKILLKWWDDHRGEKNADARMLYYLATEEKYVWPDKSIEHLKEYCSRSGWDEERAVAHLVAGQLHENANRLEEAFAEYAQVNVEFPSNPDGLFGCARVSYYKAMRGSVAEWWKVIELTERGYAVMADKTQRTSMMNWNPLDREYRPLVFLSAAYVQTNQPQKAIEAAERGLKLVPSDPHLKGNKEASERALTLAAEASVPKPPSQNGVHLQFSRNVSLDTPPLEIPVDVLVAVAIEIWKRSRLENEEQALRFLDGLPTSLSSSDKMRAARTMTVKKERVEEVPRRQSVSLLGSIPGIVQKMASSPRRNKILDISIWVGNGYESWTPDSIDNGGVGGSETAAFMVAKSLVARGHKVTVYAEADGVWDHVKFVHFSRAPQPLVADVFVTSRQPWALDCDIQAPVKVLWVHDIHVGQSSSSLHAQVLKTDFVFALSNWHKNFLLDFYRWLHRDIIHVTRNGLDMSRFAREPIKQGNRLIYSSSPNRGLDRLLQLLPRIRAEVPDAELHVYYGFDTWQKMAEMYNWHQDARYIESFKAQILSTPGVVYRGRVGQRELAEAFLASKIWAYPTAFTETSCISAMEAQAAGCVPVTTDLAALPETVKYGYLLPPPNDSDSYTDTFISHVVHLLKDEPARRQMADDARRYALSYLSWDLVAADWEAEFERIREEKRKTLIQPYQGTGVV